MTFAAIACTAWQQLTMGDLPSTYYAGENKSGESKWLNECICHPKATTAAMNGQGTKITCVFRMNCHVVMV